MDGVFKTSDSHEARFCREQEGGGKGCRGVEYGNNSSGRNGLGRAEGEALANYTKSGNKVQRPARKRLKG